MRAKGSKPADWWPYALPLAAAGFIIAKSYDFLHIDNLAAISAASLCLLGAVFAAVYHAEIVALKAGEPLGSLVLAIAVTVIEVALIASVMISAPSANSTLARDTVFSAVAIVLNGVVGLCLVFGGARYREQEFRVEGTASSLSVLATLAVLTLILPNFTTTRLGPLYSPAQLIFVGTLSLVLYAVFVFVQSFRHKDYFLTQDPAGALDAHSSRQPSGGAAGASLAFLFIALTAVILLAKALAPLIERAIHTTGLPKTVLGVVIAVLVLLPESLAAILAARANRLQTSLNLALGSAIASIGLTIPAVSALSLYLDQDLSLGLDPEDIVLLLLTLFASSLTLGTGRATILQGAVHLVIFCVFLLLSAIP